MNEIMQSIESMRWVLLGTGVALWLWFAYVVGPHLRRWWRGRREERGDLALARYKVTMKRGATRMGTPAPYPGVAPDHK